MKNGKSTVATIVLLGVAAGAAAYYLLGTEKGKETCSKWAGSLKDVGATLDDLRAKATDTIDKLTNKADKYASSVEA